MGESDISITEATRTQRTNPKWNDGWWQLRHRIRNPEHLREWIHIGDEERQAIAQTKAYFRWQITPYYASLMDPNDPSCPIRRQVLPALEELDDDIPLQDLDPLEELAHSPVKNLIHNYRDRVAFCIAADCAVYCRYCLRKRMVSDGEFALNKREIKEGLAYLREHDEIKDVLLTGGDPLTLKDRDIAWVLGELKKIDHIDVVRIGSRLPVLNPYRVTESLAKMLADFQPLWFNTHFNHAKECTPEAEKACANLVNAGIPVGNQTVLLKGVNDSAQTLRTLFRRLITMRVRPYYLYQAQLIGGTRHFRTNIEEGMRIMEELRGTLSGYAIPSYVLDTPYGKVPLTPHGFVKRDGNFVEVMSYQGKLWREYNPAT